MGLSRFGPLLASVNWAQVALILPGVAALVTAMVLVHTARRDRKAAARREHLKYQIEALSVIADNTSQALADQELDGRLLAYIYVIGEKRVPLTYAWASGALADVSEVAPGEKPSRQEVVDEVSRVMAEVANDLKRTT